MMDIKEILEISQILFEQHMDNYHHSVTHILFLDSSSDMTWNLGQTICMEMFFCGFYYGF